MSALAVTAGALTSSPAAAATSTAKPKMLTGQYKHSACKWCYKGYTLEEFAVKGKAAGLDSVELVNVEELPVLFKHGLECAMVWGVPGGITKGLNDPANHDKIAAFMEEKLPLVAAAGQPNMIVFSGNKNGQPEDEGLEACAQGLARITPIAEKYGVTLCMELLNSKVNHDDYLCDRTPWGVQLCEKVGSERFKLLYDIYHMQIMEGDVIATINEYHPYISHYHTGGVPGRNEIDETQELYYPAIVKAIMDTGYNGYIGQEFIPKRPDKLASLKQGVEICDI